VNSEEIRVNATVYQDHTLNTGDIKRSSDICYLGSVLSEYGGAWTDVNVRIQKVEGLFSKLRKVRLSTST
jgi:hypothetical protein